MFMFTLRSVKFNSNLVAHILTTPLSYSFFFFLSSLFKSIEWYEMAWNSKNNIKLQWKYGDKNLLTKTILKLPQKNICISDNNISFCLQTIWYIVLHCIQTIQLHIPRLRSLRCWAHRKSLERLLKRRSFKNQLDETPLVNSLIEMTQKKASSDCELIGRLIEL